MLIKSPFLFCTSYVDLSNLPATLLSINSVIVLLDISIVTLSIQKGAYTFPSVSALNNPVNLTCDQPAPNRALKVISSNDSFIFCISTSGSSSSYSPVLIVIPTTLASTGKFIFPP